MKKALFLLAVLFPLFAAAQRNCGTMEHYERAIQENPSYELNQQEIENFTNEFLAHYNGEDRAIVTIPVVVHVVYNTTTENISDAQILTQIDVLNKDFAKMNADAANTPSIFTASNTDIQFCLATVDPTGAATTGITRTFTSTTAFSTNDAMKNNATGGKSAWDASKYLNIWVCDISGGILGYAQFPGGSASTDGVVIDYQYFGTIGTSTAPFNLGRTATHEVGHWLNLRHIWGDATCGTDQVADTPTHNTANYGCPTYPHLSTCTGTPVEMTMNYMDYTDDACMYMFSAGQTSRMQALFATGGARTSLLSSNGCGTPAPVLCGVPSGLTSSAVTTTSATVSWAAVSGATSYTLQYKLSTATTWTTVSGLTTTSYSLTGLGSLVTYNYQVNATCPAGTGNYSAASSFTTLSLYPTCTDSYENNNSSNKAKSISVNTNVLAKISSSTDQDWFKFSNTSTNKNIKIELTTLPANYSVSLYSPTGALLLSSTNAGTANEVIVYNTTVVGSYKVRVFNVSGAFNNSYCYTLRANISASTFVRESGEDALAFEDAEIPAQATLANLNVYPNPFSSQLTAQFYSSKEEFLNVYLFDAMGKMVYETKYPAIMGNNVIELNGLNLSNGYYHFLIQNETDRVSKAIIKE
ncbi:MAG: hypothetical protein RJA38_85 [Bacteroidota bacterium]|jgi:hypothetical protein